MSKKPENTLKKSPAVLLAAVIVFVLAGLFGDDVPILNEVARFFDDFLGGGPSVTGLQGPAEVTRVSDGDTITVELDGREEKVRLTGIDTPETFASSKLDRDVEASPLSREEMRALGKEATAYAKELMEGQEVYLELDAEERDRYGRLLAYVYTRDPNGEWTFQNENFDQVNLEMVEAGWADPLTIPPNVRYTDDYVEAARVARQQNRGIWAQGWVASE